MKLKDKYIDVINFLEEYSIDEDYYLNEEARAQIDAGIITLDEIRKMPAQGLIQYLDFWKLVYEEHI